MKCEISVEKCKGADIKAIPERCIHLPIIYLTCVISWKSR